MAEQDKVVTPVEEDLPVEADKLAEDEDLEAQLAYEHLKRKREARKRKRIILAVVAAAVVLAAGIWLMAGSAKDDEFAEELDPMALTSVVYRGDFSTTVNASGATEPTSSTIVTPEVDGIIDVVKVAQGDFVNEGDVLLTLRNDDLDKAVREAEEQITAAQRALESQDRAVDNAYAARQRAWDQANEANDWSLYDEPSLNSAIADAESQRDAADDALKKATEACDEARAKAEKRTVTAPTSGSVVAMNAVEGAAVGGSAGTTASGPLVQIADLTQMKVTVQVNEVDISTIKEGQKGMATFSALPGVELEAEVQHIASVATGSGAGEGPSGIVTYAVELLIPKPDKELKPGMTATVTITTQQVPDALIVPASSLWESDGKSYVSLVTDEATGDTSDVEVHVMARNSSEAAVTGELEEGDAVLLTAGGPAVDDELMALASDEDVAEVG